MFRTNVIICLCLLWAVFLAPAAAQSQGRKPYQKSVLIEFLKKAKRQGVADKRLSDFVIKSVQQRGVDFQMTEQDEAELRAAGARTELLIAVRNSYRPLTTELAATSKSRSQRFSAPPAAPSMTGPAFSYNEIVDWLRRGTSAETLEAAVTSRRVNFVPRSEQKAAIHAVGGTDSLLQAISSAATMEARAAESARLTEEAANEIFSGPSPSWRRADELLHEALRLDPELAGAHSLHGWVKLYGFSQPNEAEREMRTAISLGGKAIFLVEHVCSDRDCKGVLEIGKSTVAYKPYRGGHPFEADDSFIKDVGVNRLVVGFHIKLHSKNYNFAPGTYSNAEAQLIVQLIKTR